MTNDKIRADAVDKTKKKGASTHLLQKQSETPQKEDGPTPAAGTDLIQEMDTDTGAALRAQGMADMQRSLGTARVNRMMDTPIQTKMTVGAPDDKYEQEAEQVSAQVMKMSGGESAPADEEEVTPSPVTSLQRQTEAIDGDEEMPLVQPQSMTQAEEAAPADLSMSIQRQTEAIDGNDEETMPQVQQQMVPKNDEVITRPFRDSVQRQEMADEAAADEEMANTPSAIQTKAEGGASSIAPQAEKKIQSARGAGQPLPGDVRRQMEGKFGADFGDVNVHTDGQADQLNRQIGSRAFATGQDIFFKRGEYEPGNPEGQKLLAHELTHVVQQNSHDRLQRREKVGSRVTHPAGAKAKFKRISGTFDGRELVVFGDGKEVMRLSGQSGKPVPVRPEHQKQFKGVQDETYLNNPRYAAAKDYGPIPEGIYKFKATQMSTFTVAEQWKIISGGYFTDPFGRKMHGGDWGAGRVPLTVARMAKSKYGGNPKSRSGFYLHGGIMPGSAGCIDVGNSAFMNLVTVLLGYKGWVTIKVRYKHEAPDVGWFDRLKGRITYPETDGNEEPSLTDRIRSIFD